MSPDREFYENRDSDIKNRLEEKDREDSRLSLIRLFLFLFFTGFLIACAATSYKILMLMIALFFAASFVVAVIFHNRLKKQIAHLRILREVNSLYLARMDGDFSVLDDKGEEFLDSKDDYSFDLDLFGERSLFSLFNISDTHDGRKTFAKDLAGASFITDTASRQKAVAELIGKKEFLEEYQTVAREGNLLKPVNALKAISSDEAVFPSWQRVLSFVLPVLWIIPLIMAVAAPLYVRWGVLAVIIINILVFVFLSGNYKVYFKAVDGIHRQTKAISALYSLCEKEDFKDPMIRDLIRGGAPEGHNASEGLSALSRACNVCKFRSQPLFALILNLIMPFDLYCAFILLRWVRGYGKELRQSLSCLASLESLMCCACVGVISRQSVFPTFSDKASFDGEEICHPLLDPKTAVSNSVSVDNKCVLITGSNMSGKTTLIRTVGVCCVLGYMGAPVPARKVSMGRMRIMSSMRIMDSIEENMSTFKAELVRIGRIVEAADDGDSILFLIDEIFRGTNSADRTDGALAVLNKLSKNDIMGFMTTHDYALCDRVEGNKDVAFFYFSETYDDEGISFDYKLHKGICKNSNAKYLMKLVGIV